MRDEFIAWLARLVADGILTQAEAAQMLAQFDKSGTVGGLPWDAPLALPTAIQGKEGIDEKALLLLLLFLLGGRKFPSATASHATLQLVNGVQGQFQQTAYQLAQQLSSGQITVAQWQTAMLQNLQTHAAAAAALARRTTGVEGATRLDTALRLQSAYLSRFADAMALKTLSAGAIASRSALYGNAIRALFYTEQAEAVGDTLGDGWIVVWHSQDDGHTCPLCIEREGTAYLPNTPHPVPGQPGLCFGRCRCWLEYVYDPPRWQALRDGGGGVRRGRTVVRKGRR